MSCAEVPYCKLIRDDVKTKRGVGLDKRLRRSSKRTQQVLLLFRRWYVSLNKLKF